MGRFADFFREQSITLDGQKKAKMISLDQEFVALEAKLKVLEAENLKLQADTNPLKREVERLQNEIKKTGSPDHATLDEFAEKILLALANGESDRARIFASLNLPKIKGDHLFDVLYERKLIENLYMTVFVTPLGRAYLVKHGLT